MAGKAWGVGRAESQETCPGAEPSSGLRGRGRTIGSSLFVLGGARSGKSRFALSTLASRSAVFVATATPGDDDLARRIARHRAERPHRWRTVEEPHDLVRVLRAEASRTDAVLVDCVTMWVANRQLRGDGDAAILGEADALAAVIREGLYDLVLVSNEVGEGVHPPTAAGMQFRDTLGLVNQRIAAASDRVVLMVAGLPLAIKDPSPTVPGVDARQTS